MKTTNITRCVSERSGSHTLSIDGTAYVMRDARGREVGRYHDAERAYALLDAINAGDQ